MSSDEEFSSHASRGNGETPKHTRTLPESDVYFAFGPQHCYFARFGLRWPCARNRVLTWLRSTSKVHVGLHSSIHSTGFILRGENNEDDGLTIHACDVGHMIPASEVDSFVKSRDAYTRLQAWISAQCRTTTKNEPRNVCDMFVSIGPKGSYFARCGSSWIARELPKDLQASLEKEEDGTYPVAVALGVNESWVVLWSDGQRAWDLKHAYPRLMKTAFLNGKDHSVIFVALDPYQEDKYLLVADNGAISYCATLDSTQESQILDDMTNKYMQMRAKRDGTTFSHPFCLDGVTKQTNITPTSNVQMGICRSKLWSWKERQNLPGKGDVAVVRMMTVGAGALSRLAGTSTLRAAGIATSFGMGTLLKSLNSG